MWFSVLSTNLFSIYINDLATLSLDVKFYNMPMAIFFYVMHRDIDIVLRRMQNT